MATNEELNWVKAECTSPNIIGIFVNADGTGLFDRRLTMDAIERQGLSPRTADLNLIGNALVELSETEVALLQAIQGRSLNPEG